MNACDRETVIRITSLSTALAGAFAGVTSALAHDFCVNSAAAIQGALAVAETNNEDETIYIQTGEYLINTALGAALKFQSTEAHDLWISGSGTSTVLNNTVVHNHTSTLAEPGGLSLQGAAGAIFDVDNNIVRDDHDVGGSDLGGFVTNARATNDIGVVTPGSTSAGFTSDISVDPQFAPCAIPGPIRLNFELARNSLLVDTPTLRRRRVSISPASHASSVRMWTSVRSRTIGFSPMASMHSRSRQCRTKAALESGFLDCEGCK